MKHLVAWKGSIGQDVWRTVEDDELTALIIRLQDKGFTDIKSRPADIPEAEWEIWV